MNIEEYRNHCISKPGVTESTPFPKLPDVLVYKVMGKMFTATDLNNFDSFSIKCVPETIEDLKDEYHVLHDPPYFSKKHWCKVVLDGSVSNDKMYEWLDISYNLVASKLTRKVKAQLESLARDEEN